MQKLNLSYNMLQDSLGQLQELSLVELQPATAEFVTTGRGLEFLTKWMQLQEFLKPGEKISIKAGKISRDN
jgi:predicted transcriptional regulator